MFLLVQHADRDPAFQAAMLPRVEAAYRVGDIDGQSLARLTDRVAKAQGRPQGLPPLAVYKRFLDSMLSHAGAP